MDMQKPQISVSITRAAGAPVNPTRGELEKLFARTWALVPKKKRPETQGSTRLLVDVHLQGDEEMARLNWAHMKHRGPTDVLAFNLDEFDPERKGFSLGEIVIGFETAKREATERKLPVTEELSRYCVHGFLHLLGYEDDTAAQQRTMFEVQEKALNVR
ncbi:MAG TPA: rRNA maturation RNase YbeY [Planctomycetota bacterium]|jgi:probable rRNA maturation factor